MFSFREIIEQTAKSSKDALAFVQDKNLRQSLQGIVDTNAEFAQNTYAASNKFVNSILDQLCSIDFMKHFAEPINKSAAEVK